MTPSEFQAWLNTHGAALVVDGKIGPATRNAVLNVFSNKCAEAVKPEDIAAIAQRLGCSEKQIRAVSIVESGGAAFDGNGRPKILFERHLFHRLTNGLYSPTIYSDASAGGYSDDSWQKLTMAASKDVRAAFGSASWGKFQVLGLHYLALGYASALDMAYSTVTSEAAHYEMLARYIEANGLKAALHALSGDPETCRDFARAYNGPNYERFRYHQKLAEAMR